MSYTKFPGGQSFPEEMPLNRPVVARHYSHWILFAFTHSILIAGIFFILLSPGLFILVPPDSRGVWMPLQTTIPAIFLHAVIFVVLLVLINLLVQRCLAPLYAEDI